MDSNFKKELGLVAEKVKERAGTKLNMVIGVDGFVDEILHVVGQRQDYDNYTRLPKIADMGHKIVGASGLSTAFEIVTIQTKLGGNGPIFSNALIEYGADLTYVGALGENEPHPVFDPLTKRSKKFYSLCDPGYTLALEFEDGKIMLGKHFSLKYITWAKFKEVLGGVDKIAQMISECNLFGMENWSMIPLMSEIWEGIINEVFPLLPKRDKKPLAFFDLAEPEKRLKEDIFHAMKLIGKFQEQFDVILGLNEKESYEIAEVFDIKVEDCPSDKDKLEFITVETYKQLGIYCLVVHPTKEAVACSGGEFFRVQGPYCQKPVLTTGAGDNFNAGFCFGQALGLTVKESLIMGVSTSGFYVRNAHSANKDDIITFLDDFANERLS